MSLYKSSKLKFISSFTIVIIFFLLSSSFLYQLLRLSFENIMEYFLAYFIFLGLLFTLFFFYELMRALPIYLYTITLEDSSLIYKKADTIIYKFDLSDIEYISQKQAFQAFQLNLKNKEKFLLPYRIKEMTLFFNTLADNYHPNINYSNQIIKAKKQGFLSILLLSIFFPFLIMPLFLSPYIILLYILGFSIAFMTQPIYLKISDNKLEIINKSKTVVLNKKEVNIELEHTYIIKYGYFYNCTVSTIEHTYALRNYNISDIDLYCLLNYWQKTHNKYEETNNLP